MIRLQVRKMQKEDKCLKSKWSREKRVLNTDSQEKVRTSKDKNKEKDQDKDKDQG